MKRLKRIFCMVLLLAMVGCSELNDFKVTFDTVNAVLTTTKPTVDQLTASGNIGKKEGAAFDAVQAIFSKENPGIQALTSWPPANAQQYYNELFPLLQPIEDALVDQQTHPALNLFLSTAEVLIQELISRLESDAGVHPIPGMSWFPRHRHKHMSRGAINKKLAELKTQAESIKQISSSH